MASNQRHARSKSKFDSARAAWSDIAAKTGLEPDNIKRTAHTSTLWVFIEK